ncbi:MerR family transcriptional regulator [Bacillus sp. SD088]|uniref:MerR family transcriptional regulator n=1 Tax=Bacillus sp. SD088 TaxID=2782012 RepID=UPI001DA71556|nr:MerR family transcriptional regulator [Bacillus sp. SD088]MBO0994147.1 MerR family transcriptional regulator [Bacillus sp. SD088]
MITIKNTAERESLPPSTIRYYDAEGLLPFVERDSNGYHLFKEEDLFWIELIGCMRETGMSIEILRHVVRLNMKGEDTLKERVSIFEEHQEKSQNKKRILMKPWKN